ncbi:uncharacterized protein BO95DRAFT_432315 [Aspergillus brunneoviolaceus CBS 621.78]|uniref:Uncharacterized protein n=1 Tax=Aspergillus brunneoviolaceus CBS 621.78 TaxID=1450534 RepID=A0ACD1G8A7_9EURO|nr:hypothetical protein BO95DRAFT_432315 [Aspergillus brunneoviolaceus CBS 621.78]RAH45361.1 hypothetical protein BO95DRAFT_432315 [Aspergillus brunneoviolaceus CBS 621.78]
MYCNFFYLLTCIAPLVKGTDRVLFFALGFLSQLDQQLEVGTFPKEEESKLYRDIACGLLSRLDVSTFNNPAHPSVAGFSQTLAAIFYAYIGNYLGLKPSSATSNIVCPTIQSCCGNCYDVNRFPRDPVSRVWVQPMSKKRRAHIHQKLDQARVDCIHETDHSRWTNPKLVVTKTFAQVGDSQLAWQQRKLEASKQIQSFDQVRLTVLLLDDYENIVRMRALDVPSEQPVASRSESTPTSLSQQYQPGFHNFPPAPNVPSLAGMKRTAEEADFVDLTLDD